MRFRPGTEYFGGNGVGEWVPKIGTDTFWTVGKVNPTEIREETKCHAFENSYGRFALVPYWGGLIDDPQYDEYKVGGNAFYTREEAVVASERYKAEARDRLTRELDRLKPDGDG